MAVTTKKAKLECCVGEKVEVAEASPAEPVVELGEHTRFQILELKFPAANVPQVVPLLNKVFPKTTLDICRTTYSSWASDLKKQYRNHPLNLCLHIEQTEGIRIPNFVTNFTNVGHLEQFFYEMESHPDNPFLSGSINVQWPDFSTYRPVRDGDVDILFADFSTKLENVLGRFGAYVNSACIGYSGPSLYTNPFNLLSSLPNLPNLKKITLSGHLCYDFDELLSWNERNQPPRMEDLETLEIIGLGMVFVYSFLRFKCVPTRIKRLSLETRPAVMIDRRITTFVNLEVLRIRFDWRDSHLLSNLRSMRHLRILDVNFMDFEITVQQILIGLEPVQNSLTDLTVRVNNLQMCRMYRINLPRLQCLKFVFETVNIGEIDENIFQSEMWGSLPGLQTLTIGFNTFERPIAE
ncbi:unnamed protein product [Orchesella dallaii]|uniref:Uncharacterized protein n=1 Tax=Orchesella dallaii TaxID=48710 RepID=A0ABP1R8L4_9HEXA